MVRVTGATLPPGEERGVPGIRLGLAAAWVTSTAGLAVRPGSCAADFQAEAEHASSMSEDGT